MGNIKYSVSVHNGSKVNISHNNRDKESIYTQLHINKDGDFEIWKNENLKSVYISLFNKAVQDYNENQKRNDRKIKSYYEKIENGKDKKNNPKLAYELIVAVGNMEESIEDEELNKKILKEYFEQWEQRNPNLKIFNAVYHNDEKGVPHLHIDYVPFAHYDKGLSIRNSLNKALNEMGFDDDKFSNTPIMRWQKAEQAALMNICSQYGVETEIKNNAKREHLEKEEYISFKKKENIEKDIHNLKIYSFELEEQNEKQKQVINYNADMIDKQEEIKEHQKKEIKENEKEVFKIQDALNSIDEEIKKYKIENAQYKTNFINYFNNLINNFTGFCNYQEREKVVDTLTDYIKSVGDNIKGIDNKENSMSEIISFIKKNTNTKSNNRQKQNDFEIEF
ncbi:MAG: plasmid recombination protein [Lachnoclostridium sp.]|nr:plasmid recombination protein [Lachnoclostridium sp.]